jgi:hypothetical protein
MLRELADLIGDLDYLELDDREMACLQSIALFNPCKYYCIAFSNYFAYNFIFLSSLFLLEYERKDCQL